MDCFEALRITFVQSTMRRYFVGEYQPGSVAILVRTHHILDRQFLGPPASGSLTSEKSFFFGGRDLFFLAGLPPFAALTLAATWRQ
jgi:hypothetical protein